MTTRRRTSHERASLLVDENSKSPQQNLTSLNHAARMHATARWPEVRTFSKSQVKQCLVKIGNGTGYLSGRLAPPPRRLGFWHSVAAAARDDDPEDSLVGADVLGQEFGNDRSWIFRRLGVIGDISVCGE
jgi:hypothetical protein